MVYDEKDAICLFLLKDWNKFVAACRGELKEIYEGSENRCEKIRVEAEFKILNYIDKVIKEEFLC